MSKGNQVRSQREIVNVLVGEIVGSVESDDGRQKRPGAKGPGLESSHLLVVGVVGVDSSSGVSACISLGGVEGGSDGHNELPPGQETGDLGQEGHVGCGCGVKCL